MGQPQGENCYYLRNTRHLGPTHTPANLPAQKSGRLAISQNDYEQHVAT